MTALNYPRAGPQETFTYAAMSNLTGIGGNLCNAEDNNGNCTGWSPMQWVSGAAYSNIGQLTGFTLAFGGVDQASYGYTYDTLQQLTGIGYNNTNLANTVVNFTYTYPTGHNNGGQRVSLTEAGQRVSLTEAVGVA